MSHHFDEVSEEPNNEQKAPHGNREELFYAWRQDGALGRLAAANSPEGACDLPSALDGTGVGALDEVVLEGDEHDQNRQQR
ncbi:hypothetical protein J31TS4_13390 [Paenibacillus sp. J31TS4]|nr:hypothetical protein J31TS4_13390 [Paenibacillus sp. J31TS4]